MSVHREAPFPGTEQELESVLRAWARAFGGLAHRRAPGWIVTAGSSLALNPNEVKWTGRAVLDQGTLRLAADVVTFPWSRRRARRILEARADQLVDFVETKLRGGASEKFAEPVSRRPFAAIGPGVSGACTAVASWAAQITAALVATLAVSLLLGLILIHRQVAVLEARSETLRNAAALQLPPRAELDSIDFGFRLGAGALLVLPTVFLVGFAYGLLHALGDLWAAASRAAFWLYLFFVLLLLFSLWAAAPPHVSVGFAFLIPTAAHAGVSLVWAARRERRREPRKPDPATRRRSLVYLVGGALGAVVLLVGFVPWPNGDFIDRLAQFRDRFMLPNAPGRALAEFYYRHTLYAAEAIKPAYVRPGADRRRDPGAIRTVFLCSSDEEMERSLRDGIRALNLLPDVTKLRNAAAKIVKSRHDLYVGNDDPTLVGYLSAAGVERRTLIVHRMGRKPPAGFQAVEFPSALDRFSAALEEVSESSFAGAGLSQLSFLGWASVFFGAPLYLLLAAAGVVAVPVAILYRKARAGVAHAVVGFAFLASVGIMAAVLSAHSDEIGKVRTIRSLPAEGAAELAGHLSDASADVRYEAAFRAWQLRVAVPREALEDPDVRVRIWACGALGRAGDRRAVPALLQRLEDPEVFVRYRAAEALGDLGAREAVEPLLRLIATDGWYVGAYSLAALRRIAPEKF